MRIRQADCQSSIIFISNYFGCFARMSSILYAQIVRMVSLKEFFLYENIGISWKSSGPVSNDEKAISFPTKHVCLNVLLNDRNICPFQLFKIKLAFHFTFPKRLQCEKYWYKIFRKLGPQIQRKQNFSLIGQHGLCLMWFFKILNFLPLNLK